MGLARTFLTLGTWIEKHFPEKLTAAEVEGRMLTIEAQVGVSGSVLQQHAETITKLADRIAELEKKAELVNSDLNKTKIMLLTQRQTAGR